MDSHDERITPVGISITAKRMLANDSDQRSAPSKLEQIYSGFLCSEIKLAF